MEDRWRSQSFRLAAWATCYGVAVSPDGRWVVGVGVLKLARGELHIWELPSQKEVKTFSTLQRCQLQFSPDGRWLLAATDTALCYWEVGTWRQAYVSPYNDFESGWHDVTVSRDSRWAAFSETGGAVQLVSLPTLMPIMSLRSIPGRPVCLSPDGSWLLVRSANGPFGLWNLRRINKELAPMGLGWRDP